MDTSEVKLVPTPAKKTWRQRLLRLLRSLLFIYLGVMLGISMLQEWFIFPGQSSQGQPSSIIPTLPDHELVKLTTSTGDTIYVLMGKALDSDGATREDFSNRPTLVVFYGNGMCLSDLIDLSRDWRKLGANVIGVEYPGYGMSSGKPGEQPFYSAANATWDYLKGRGDIDMSKIIPTGISIGGSVATDLAHTHPAAGLILLAPFTSLDDMAKEVMPWLPGFFILRHHFNNSAKIGNLRMPILIFHGKNDSIIPARMSEELTRKAVNATSLKRFVLDTDHNNLFALAEDDIKREMKQLIDHVAAQ